SLAPRRRRFGPPARPGTANPAIPRRIPEPRPQDKPEGSSLPPRRPSRSDCFSPPLPLVSAPGSPGAEPFRPFFAAVRKNKRPRPGAAWFGSSSSRIERHFEDPRMNRRRRVYEGKAKVLYEGPEPGTLIQHFKDDATAFNNKKHALIEGKGVLN